MKINLKTLLLTGAAIFAAWNIGMVGAFIEGKPAGSVSVGGLFGGAVVSLALAISSANISALREGSKRERYGNAFYFSLLAISIFSVGITTYYRLENSEMNTVARIILSISYPALADLAIAAAGNITGKSFIQIGEQSNKKTNNTNTKRTKTNTEEQKTNTKRTANEQPNAKNEQGEQAQTLSEQVTNVLKDDPNASLRDIVKLTEIKSTSTASRYRKEVNNEKSL